MKKLPTLADRLVHARKRKGLTQFEVAAQAGIRPEVLNRIERGKSNGALLSLHKLAPVLGMSIDELVGLTPAGGKAPVVAKPPVTGRPATGRFPAMVKTEPETKAAQSGRKGKKRR